jgi:ubiquinone/menaquinone biosynthesis C-methylase UbiE
MTMQERISASGWQLALESARSYERDLVPSIFMPLAARLLDTVAPRPGDHLLDVACGTGAVARQAAARVGTDVSVTGLDLNEGMLAVAKEVAGAVGPIEWQQGDAMQLPFADARFHVAVCQQGLQFMPSPQKALNEMSRVLKADGRLGLTVWRTLTHNPAWSALARILDEHVGLEAGAQMRSPFDTWTLEDLRALVAHAGFRDIKIQIGAASARFPSIPAILQREGDSSPFAADIAALSDAAYKQAVAAMETAFREQVDDEGVVFPMQTYIVTARK